MIHYLFIDAAVNDVDTLQAQVKPGTIVHRIRDDVDGFKYITQALDTEQIGSAHNKENSRDLTISIVTSGRPGALSLGNAVLTLASLERYRDCIQKWFSATPLHPGHYDRLQLYSCDVGASSDGQELLKYLHKMTYATVYASTTEIGKALIGASWPLDILVNTWNTRLTPLFGYSQPPAPQSPFSFQPLVTYS